MKSAKRSPSIYEPIYKANVKCATFSQPSIHLDCGQLNFTLTTTTTTSNSLDSHLANEDFIIDNKTASIFYTSKSINSSPQKSNLLISSFLSNNKNDRFISSAQTYLSLNMHSPPPPSSSSSLRSISNRLTFEKLLYKVQILNTLPVNSFILSLKYKYEMEKDDDNDDDDLEFFIENESNLQIETNFYLKHSKMSREIFLLNRVTPLPLDKPEINFNLRLIRRNNDTTQRVECVTSVNMLILVKRLSAARLNFVTPDSANYVIMPEAITVNASIIYQFQTTMKTYESLIVYTILNREYMNLFFIDGTFLRMYYPFPETVDKKRLNYLVMNFDFLTE
jgi:hypothetical protein